MLLIKHVQFVVYSYSIFRHVCNTAKHLLNLFNQSVYLPVCMKQSENHVTDPYKMLEHFMKYFSFNLE
jgi:hypothetical protein